MELQDCFVLDAGKHFGLWVWVGKNATEKERLESMKYAQVLLRTFQFVHYHLNFFTQEFVTREKYPPNMPIARVIDGAEPFEFKALFGNEWR